MSESKKVKLPRCPEPLGLKLYWQAFFVNDRSGDGTKERAIAAMRKTLDEIERYELYRTSKEMA